MRKRSVKQQDVGYEGVVTGRDAFSLRSHKSSVQDFGRLLFSLESRRLTLLLKMFVFLYRKPIYEMNSIVKKRCVVLHRLLMGVRIVCSSTFAARNANSAG
ncbi:hypothetical protein ACMGD3_11975 [Lysinibacillus sphaericus]|uniref:hypothetical protein n=1 Tax=Lysinibacillus sphaericus TaxID=1421 RepID=UPI003F7A147A